MLRKFVSCLACTCMKKQDETDEPDQQNNDNITIHHPNKCFVERPKSRDIPIPLARSFSRDYEADARMIDFRANRNKCRQRATEIQMARITRQDSKDLDERFQFTESQGEGSVFPPRPSDPDSKRSSVTAGNSSSRTNLPKNCIIKMGSIVESSDGSLPSITVVEKASEQTVFRLADVDSMALRRSSLRETGIYYNTNNGTVELHGGLLHNDYTI